MPRPTPSPGAAGGCSPPSARRPTGSVLPGRVSTPSASTMTTPPRSPRRSGSFSRRPGAGSTRSSTMAEWPRPGRSRICRPISSAAQFETNFFGWHELTRLVIPVMRRQGHGRIVFCSSVLGFVAARFRGAYVASKFAVEGYADTLRVELGGSGIDVVLIEPGPIRSRILGRAREPDPRHPRRRGFAPSRGLRAGARPAGGRRKHVAVPQRAGGGGREADPGARKSAPAGALPGDVPDGGRGGLKRVLPTRVLDRIVARVRRR